MSDELLVVSGLATADKLRELLEFCGKETRLAPAYRGKHLDPLRERIGDGDALRDLSQINQSLIKLKFKDGVKHLVHHYNTNVRYSIVLRTMKKPSELSSDDEEVDDEDDEEDEEDEQVKDVKDKEDEEDEEDEEDKEPLENEGWSKMC